MCVHTHFCVNDRRLARIRTHKDKVVDDKAEPTACRTTLKLHVKLLDRKTKARENIFPLSLLSLSLSSLYACKRHRSPTDGEKNRKGKKKKKKIPLGRATVNFCHRRHQLFPFSLSVFFLCVRKCCCCPLSILPHAHARAHVRTHSGPPRVKSEQKHK